MRAIIRPSIIAVVGVSLLTRPTGSFADDTLDQDGGGGHFREALVTPETDEAVHRGLAYLASRQRPDGAFASPGFGQNVGVVALAGLAFLAEGSTPKRGRYGQEIARCVDFLLEQADESGLITNADAAERGPMYGHGFATLFLAEVHGMGPRRDLRDKLVRAVDLVVRTQNEEGGWRYQPRRKDADISVTVCQVMALRAARNAGCYVPQDTIAKSIEYVRACQNPDGGFAYQSKGGDSRFPRSAAALVALYSAGIYEGPVLEKGRRYLEQHMPRDGAARRHEHFFYGQYYAAQVMWQTGGEVWSRWYRTLRDRLLAEQQDTGAWSDTISSEYGTAMACIVLQMPNDVVPIFQR